MVQVINLIETNLYIVKEDAKDPIWAYSSNGLDIPFYDSTIRWINRVNAKQFLEEDMDSFGLTICSIYDLRF